MRQLGVNLNTVAVGATLLASVAVSVTLGSCRRHTPPVVVDPTPAINATINAVHDATAEASRERAAAIDAVVSERIARLSASVAAIDGALRVVRDVSTAFDVAGRGSATREATDALVAVATARVAAAIGDCDHADLRAVDHAIGAILASADVVVAGWDSDDVGTRSSNWAALQQDHDALRASVAQLNAATEADPWAVWLSPACAE